MKHEFIRTASHSYMTVKEIDLKYDEWKMQMLTGNRIPGLLNMKALSENGKQEYWYDITGLAPVRLSGSKVDWEMLGRIVRNICDVKLALEQYLLDADDLVYDEKYIFQDRKTNQYRFCYIPGLMEQQKNGLLTLMENVLECLDHNDPRTVRAGYEIYESCAAGEAGVEKLMGCITEHTSLPRFDGRRGSGQTLLRAQKGPFGQTDIFDFDAEAVTREPMQVREAYAWSAETRPHRAKSLFSVLNKEEK